MSKNKIVKRIDPNAPKIPLKNFQPQTRVTPLDNVDPALAKMMKEYQKRGSDLIDNLETLKDIQQQREEKAAEKAEQEEEAKFAKELLDERAKLPNDIVQRIVSGEEFDDTDIDTKPKKEILTREDALKRMKEKTRD